MKNMKYSTEIVSFNKKQFKQSFGTQSLDTKTMLCQLTAGIRLNPL